MCACVQFHSSLAPQKEDPGRQYTKWSSLGVSSSWVPSQVVDTGSLFNAATGRVIYHIPKRLGSDLAACVATRVMESRRAMLLDILAGTASDEGESLAPAAEAAASGFARAGGDGGPSNGGDSLAPEAPAAANGASELGLPPAAASGASELALAQR